MDQNTRHKVQQKILKLQWCHSHTWALKSWPRHGALKEWHWYTIPSDRMHRWCCQLLLTRISPKQCTFRSYSFNLQVSLPVGKNKKNTVYYHFKFNKAYATSWNLLSYLKCTFLLSAGSTAIIILLALWQDQCFSHTSATLPALSSPLSIYRLLWFCKWVHIIQKGSVIG